MKKVFLTVIAAAAIISLASCGGNSASEKALTPAEKTVSFCEDMKAALEANDMEKAMKIAKEVAEWEKGLSEEDKKAAAEATANWLKANPEVANMY